MYVLSSSSRQVKALNFERSESISIVDFALENFINLLPQTFQLFNASNASNLSETLSPAFSRASFLDFSVDMIKNSNEYTEVVNFNFYVKSLLDNLLTPGFNIFDAPKASNALRGIYTLGRPLSISELLLSYHSDQFNIYGEYYNLFWGWLSMPFIFISAYYFRLTVYYRLRKQSFTNLLLKFFWAKTFYSWLISFGLDWIIIETFFGYIAFRLNMFFLIRESKS
jgi:hypothetical protein